MPTTLIRVGLAIFVGGLISFFFNHNVVLAAIISGLGYVLFVIGVILWSVETTGDVSFS